MVQLQVITAACAWIGLVLQYVLLLGSAPGGVAVTTVQYFTYFTILSNRLVALVSTFTLLSRPLAARAFFTSPRVRGAAAVYIAVTGGIYFGVLRHLWS